MQILEKKGGEQFKTFIEEVNKKILEMENVINGKGKTKNEGLYDYEINKICKTLGLNNMGFIGTIPFEKLKNMMEYIEDKKYNYFSFIINESDNMEDNQHNKHW